jgi:hypothetical protein
MIQLTTRGITHRVIIIIIEGEGSWIRINALMMKLLMMMIVMMMMMQ